MRILSRSFNKLVLTYSFYSILQVRLFNGSLELLQFFYGFYLFNRLHNVEIRVLVVLHKAIIGRTCSCCKRTGVWGRCQAAEWLWFSSVTLLQDEGESNHVFTAWCLSSLGTTAIIWDWAVTVLIPKSRLGQQPLRGQNQEQIPPPVLITVPVAILKAEGETSS